MLAELTVHALAQMLRYRTQTLLAVLGVAIGVANIIMLISITDLGRRQATGLMRDFGSTMLMVTPCMEMEGGMGGINPAVAAAFIPAETSRIVRAVPEIEAAAGFVLLPAHASAGDKSCFTTVAGVEPDFAALVAYHPQSGRWLSVEEQAQAARVCCLGESVARSLFAEADPVGQQLQVKGETFTVVGLMQRKGRVGLEDFDSRVIVPLSTAQQLFQLEGINAVMSHYRQNVGEKRAVAAVKQALSATLAAGEPVDEAFSVLTMLEARQLLDRTLSIFRTVLGGIASIAMLVAGIGIMNVMLIRVMQRRKEIGIRRAVGATPRLIMLQFLLESTTQALAGAVAGLALGIAGVFLYCRYAQWEPFINAWTIVLAIFYSALVGIVFGAYPAARAAQLDPIASLRQDI